MTIRSAKDCRLSWRTALRGLNAIAVFGAALVLPVIPVALAAEIPPYPYLAPPWMTALRKKLKAPMDGNFEKIPLQKALERVSTATGVSIRFAAEAREAANKIVSPSIGHKELPADVSMVMLLSFFRLTYKLAKDGVVVIKGDQADTDFAEAEEIGKWIECLHNQRFPPQRTREEKAEEEAASAKRQKAEKERTEKTEREKKALRLTKITEDFVDASLAKIVKVLREVTGVRFVIDPDIDAQTRKLTIKGGRSAEKILDEVLRSLGLKAILIEDEQVRFITSAENPWSGELHVFCAWKEEHKAAETKILAQKLTRDLEGSRVCDVVRALAADLGVKVFPDSSAWETEVTLGKKTAGLTVKQLTTLLKRKGIEVGIAPSPPSYQQRSVPESVAGQPRRPPGLPDADWSIYLLRRKKP